MFNNLPHQLLVLLINKFSIDRTFLLSRFDDSNIFIMHYKKTISARKIQKAYRRYRLCKYRMIRARMMAFARFWTVMGGGANLRYSS
jgi:hypothetical protein